MAPAEHTLTVHGRSAASPDAVWALLVDATAWSRWSRIPSAVRERDVTLTADGTGTLITWRARFVPKWPGTGRALEQFFRSTLTSFARGLAKHASS